MITVTMKGAAKAPGAEDKAPAVPTPSGPSIVGPAIVGSVGIVVLAAGVGALILGRNEQAKADDYQARGERSETSASDRQELLAAASARHDAAQNDTLIGLVLGAGGVLLIAGGVTWYLLQRSSARTAAVPVVGPGYAGGAFTLAF